MSIHTNTVSVQNPLLGVRNRLKEARHPTTTGESVDSYRDRVATLKHYIQSDRQLKRCAINELKEGRLHQVVADLVTGKREFTLPEIYRLTTQLSTKMQMGTWNLQHIGIGANESLLQGMAVYGHYSAVRPALLFKKTEDDRYLLQSFHYDLPTSIEELTLKLH
jgi:hypothetical protein